MSNNSLNKNIIKTNTIIEYILILKCIVNSDSKGDAEYG